MVISSTVTVLEVTRFLFFYILRTCFHQGDGDNYSFRRKNMRPFQILKVAVKAAGQAGTGAAPPFISIILRRWGGRLGWSVWLSQGSDSALQALVSNLFPLVSISSGIRQVLHLA